MAGRPRHRAPDAGEAAISGRGQRPRESAIRTDGLSDLYVVLGDARDGAWVVRAYVNPLAPFIWLGAFLMALGGVLGRARIAPVTAPPRRGARPDGGS